MEHHGIPPDFWAPLTETVSVRIDAARPRVPLAGPPLTSPPPALDGFSIHP